MPEKRSVQRPAVSRKRDVPWGSIVGFTAVGVFAVGVIGYAAVAGQPAEAGDIDGVAEFADLPRNHVTTPVDYPQDPPVGGEHDAAWLTCDGVVYDQTVPDENAVHGLEHGAAWITYSPAVDPAGVEQLADQVDGVPYRFMSPRPEQEAPVVVGAWGTQLTADSADDPRIADFLEVYTQGPQTPEPGASCSGGVDPRV